MGQRRYKGNYAALKVVRNKLRGEDYVIVMGRGGKREDDEAFKAAWASYQQGI